MLDELHHENQYGRALAYCVVVAFAFVNCGCGSMPILDAAEQVTLYSIDGRDFEPGQAPKAEEKFHGYPVLGKIVFTDAEKCNAVVGTLNEGLAQSDGKIAACFWPRHGMRAEKKGRTIDYVICFECSQVRASEGSSMISKPFSREWQPVLDKYLREAGITLAPSSFPPWN